MARRTRGRFIRPPAKTTVWVGVNLGLDIVAASALTFLGSLSATALALRPFTIVRTRLHTSYDSDQVSAGEIPFGMFGMIVVNDKAITAGVTAIPGPATDINDDFFVHQGMSQRFTLITAIGAFEGAPSWQIDSKAMRKVDLGDDVAMMFEQTATVGASLITLGRMLVKLH